MKTNISNETKEKARKLVLIAKEKDIIKSHTIAFDEFPVEKEVHKGKSEE